MSNSKAILKLVVPMMITLWALYGCDDSPRQAPQPTPTASPAYLAIPPIGKPTIADAVGVDASQLLDQAQAAMSHLKTYHVSMTSERDLATPAPTPSSHNDEMMLKSIALEADVMLPDKERVIEDVGRKGSFTAITIGRDSYFKQPTWSNFMKDRFSEPKSGDAMSGPLLSVAVSGGFDTPAQLASFRQGVSSFSVVGDERIDGIETTHIRLLYDLGRTDSLTNKMIDDAFDKIGEGLSDGTPAPTRTPGSLGKITRDLWIAKTTKKQSEKYLACVEGASLKADCGDKLCSVERHREPPNPSLNAVFRQSDVRLAHVWDFSDCF